MAYSQGNQEQWLLEYFGDHVGVAVDVGANDGVFFSNTKAMEERGWRVLCIEPNAENLPALRLNRSEVYHYGVMDYDGEGAFMAVEGYGPTMPGSTMTPVRSGYAVKRLEIVPVRRLDSIFAEADVDAVDFLNLDIEGGEARALRGLDFDRCPPRLILVEDGHEPAEIVLECRAILGDRYREIHRILDDVFFERVDK